MAEIDGAGIYALANRPSTPLQTPFEALQQTGQAAQVVNANRLFRAGLARGQIMQQAIDPATGMPNPATANRLLASSNDPDVALVAPEAVNQNQALQGSQQRQAMERFQFGANAVSSLLADNNGAGPSWDRVKETLAAALHGQYMTAQDAHALVVSMPKDDSPASMAARRQIIMGLNDQLIAAQQRLQNVSNAPMMLDRGSGQQPAQIGGLRSAAPNVVAPTGAIIPTYTGPGTNAAMQETYEEDPNRPGTYIRTLKPRSALPGASGATIPDPFAPAPAGGGGGVGRYPRQASAGNAPAPNTPAPNVPVLAAPPSGVPERQNADIEQFTSARKDADGATSRIQTLQEARTALADARTGKASSGLQSVLSVLNTVNPDWAKKVGDVTGTDVEKYDLARKYLNDYMRNSGAAAQSDAQLAAAAGSNASTDITNQAAQHVVSLQIGRERQRIVQVQEHKDATGIGFGAHANRFTTSTDPRGFAWDTYTQAQRQQIVQSAKQAGSLDKLDRSIAYAAQHKMFRVPGAQ